MISFVIRTDVHISDKSPESRCDDYLETCLDKLSQVSDIAKRRGVDAVLDNGDFFHRKTATKNSHALVRKVSELHNREYPCPVYENPGNHDFPWNVEYVSKQPLGVLFATGVFNRLEDVTFEDGDLKVRVVGFPYTGNYDIFDFDIDRGDEDVLIACVHEYASPEGGDIFGDETAFAYSDLAECTPDVFVFGHWHIDQGIQEVLNTKFFNLGSLTRGSLVEDNLERVPRVGYLSIEKKNGDVSINTEAIELDVKPSDEIFDLEERKRLEEEQEDIDKFINTLKSSSEDDDKDDIHTTIKGLDGFESSIRDKALEYLDKASSG